MLLTLDVIVVVPTNDASFACGWFGLDLPEPGDIFSASVSNELSMFSVSFLWWIIWMMMIGVFLPISITLDIYLRNFREKQIK